MWHPPLQSYIRRWALNVDSVFETPSSSIAFAHRDGRAVVLKVAKPGSDEAHAYAVLRRFAGRGAVALLEHQDTAVLMERAMPGTALTELVLAGRDDEATEIVCDVAAVLHNADPADAEFIPVDDFVDALTRHRSAAGSPVPPAWLDRAQKLFVALLHTQGQRRLLHGDLHHDNVVYDHARGWLAIDPKGYVGEAAYEFGALLRNPTDDPTRFAARRIIERRIAIISERTHIDAQRLTAWAFAQAVLSAVWDIEDRRPPARGLATAEALWPLL